MSKTFIFSSESVTEGHPDKVCDAVSDAVLDAYLEQDPKSRVAVETIGSHGIVLVTGEVTTLAKGVDVEVVNDNSCIEMMNKFIDENPILLNEDIGEE